MAIGYLPLAVVHMNFTALAHSRRTRRLTERYPQLGDFLEYIFNTYVRHRATFPPPLWNVFDRRMDQRTNNNVEASNSQKILEASLNSTAKQRSYQLKPGSSYEEVKRQNRVAE